MAYVADRPTEFDVDEQLNKALEQARAVCKMDANSSECAAAWDAVEEIQAEISHKRQSSPKSGFETYCNDHPDADECRVYDV